MLLICSRAQYNNGANNQIVLLKEANLGLRVTTKGDE